MIIKIYILSTGGFYMTNHLIVGYGEIGKAVHEVLKKNKENEIYYIDKNAIISLTNYDFLHICFPYSRSFVKQCKKYKEMYGGLMVIHSTVKLGTTEKLNACHSPVVGIHPHLAKSIMTFKKFFAGYEAYKISEEFKKCGVKVQIALNSRNTESAKIWSTTYFGWLIVFNKELKKYCDKNDLDFDFINSTWNQNYNEGYKKLGTNFVKPILKFIKGKIGGHCVVPNAKILKGKIGNIIKKY